MRRILLDHWQDPELWQVEAAGIQARSAPTLAAAVARSITPRCPSPSVSSGPWRGTAAASGGAGRSLRTALRRRARFTLSTRALVVARARERRRACAGCAHADEHRRLRSLAAALAAGDLEPLAEFAGMLSAHVRFEERELFERAQQVIPADELRPSCGADC